MAATETFFDKMMQKDSVTPVRRLIIGGLLAASAVFGIVPIAITSVASIAINTTVMSYERKIQQKKLTNFYKDEIAALRHKSPDDVTIEDLKQVAAPVAEGGQGIETLNQELKELNARRKLRIIGSAVTSLITTGILITLSVNFPDFLATGLTRLLGLGTIGFGYTAIAKTVAAINHALFGAHETEDMVNQRLMRIAEEIKEKPANPVEIFGLFVDANPDLAHQVKQNFQAEFYDLPVIQKKQVVEAYEPQLRIIALTDAMNKGSIKPSLVGIIASGHANDAMAGYSGYRNLFDTPVQKMSDHSFDISAGDIALSDYRKRVLAERETLGIKSLH